MSSRPPKSSMAELKLRRLTEHNARLREDLDRTRVKVSEAAAGLIRYCRTTKDHLVPSVWGPVDKKDDPYSGSGAAAGGSDGGGCCSIA